MKVFVIIFLAVLFLLSIIYFFTTKDECSPSESVKTDKRAVEIRRAKQNLHPVINRNVDRLPNGRFCKKT